MKISGMSSPMSESDAPHVGVNTFDSAQSTEQPEEVYGQPELGSGTKWTKVTNPKMAQSVTKRMYRTLPSWQLTSSLDLLCDNPPDLLGVARMTKIHFITPDLAANVATLVSFHLARFAPENWLF